MVIAIDTVYLLPMPRRVSLGAAPMGAWVLHGKNNYSCQYIEIIECEYDWLCCIKISDSTKECYLLNVYLLSECEDYRDICNDCLAKLLITLIARISLQWGILMPTYLDIQFFLYALKVMQW